MMKRNGNDRFVIIGGGAAGLAAAIAAAREVRAHPSLRAEILVLDALDVPGRKLLATGNGRCNLTNRVQTRECYRSGNALIPDEFFQPEWDREIREFMRSVGVLLHERRDGYLYPRTDQAAAVRQALVREAYRCGIEIRSGCRVTECARREDGRYQVTSQRTCSPAQRKSTNAAQLASSGAITADRVLLSTGGMVSRTYGCLGDGYRIAMSMGHTVTSPAPALCALKVRDPNLKLASGVRTAGRVTLQQGGRILAGAEGEMQFTDQGISGIPVFQISRYASRALLAGGAGGEGSGDLTVSIDFLPELDEKAWEEERRRRLLNVCASDTLGDFCCGLLPDGVASWLLSGHRLVREKKIRNISYDAAGAERDASEADILRQILKDMRDKTVPVIGTEDWEKAQVTAGGIPLREVRTNMESVLSPGCYFAGEILDVDGMCGGYNLTWAFHSGLLSGRSAIRSLCNI